MLLLLIAGLLYPTQAACGQQSPTDGTPADPGNAPRDPAPDAVRLPDGILDGGTGWLNTSHPITMKELRGKVVLFDFWTYCCINCMHVLPDLKFLEQKYPNELVVIGVHSAKFDNEKDLDNIRNAVMRHGIEHPVVNDSEMTIWRKFGVRAWPTLALVDPRGRYLGSRSGEGGREMFDTVITAVIRYHRTAGDLDDAPIAFDLETRRAASTPLKYPGKVLADEKSKRLFISDTSHNRIIIADLDGSLVDIVGSGQIGRQDGSWPKVEFDHPQGLCLVGSTLYVADTENHLIRTIDLESRTVSTLAGTGVQSLQRRPLGALEATSLNSPWDLCHVDGVLYIAMAGPHQIWAHELGSDRLQIHAGNGREDVINGFLAEASFAQPSGLAVSKNRSAFYVADSEGSAIRRVPVALDGAVITIAGTSELPRGQSLFAFGHVDGRGSVARFQHPIGVVCRENTLYVADSYNHRIRTVDLTTNHVDTWLGEAQPSDLLEPIYFNEPSGLSVAGNTLFVADTNNHRICAVDVASKVMRVLKLDGLQPPQIATQHSGLRLSADAVTAEEFVVPPAGKVSVRIRLSVPKGGKVNDLMPVSWELANLEGNILDAGSAQRGKATVHDDVATVSLSFNPAAESGILGFRIRYGYCESESDLCRIATADWMIPIRIDPQSSSQQIELTIPQRKATSEFTLPRTVK